MSINQPYVSIQVYQIFQTLLFCVRVKKNLTPIFLSSYFVRTKIGIEGAIASECAPIINIVPFVLPGKIFWILDLNCLFSHSLCITVL